MPIYTQRTTGYQFIKLGFGDGSFWSYGCKVTAFAQGLLKFGFSYDPIQMNDLLKENKLFTGSTKNLMDDANITRLNFVEYYKRIDSFTIEQLATLIKDHVVIGEVSAVPIGGTGQHFVCVDGVDGQNAIIIDPWFGDRIKVASRYNSYGNIKSLRTYKIKGATMSTIQVDSAKFEELVTKATKLDDLNTKGYVLMSDYNAKMNELNTANQEAYKKGFADGKASAPTQVDPEWELNGKTVEKVDGNTTTIYNYKRKN